MSERTSRAWVRMSWPKIRAVPEVGLWKPRSALIRVDLPAPLGPSRPMDRPVSVALSCFRMVREPKRISRPSSSMTGGIPLLERSAGSECSREMDQPLTYGAVKKRGDTAAARCSGRSSQSYPQYCSLNNIFMLFCFGAGGPRNGTNRCVLTRWQPNYGLHQPRRGRQSVSSIGHPFSFGDHAEADVIRNS